MGARQSPVTPRQREPTSSQGSYAQQHNSHKGKPRPVAHQWTALDRWYTSSPPKGPQSAGVQGALAARTARMARHAYQAGASPHSVLPTSHMDRQPAQSTAAGGYRGSSLLRMESRVENQQGQDTGVGGRPSMGPGAHAVAAAAVSSMRKEATVNRKETGQGQDVYNVTNLQTPRCADLCQILHGSGQRSSLLGAAQVPAVQGAFMRRIPTPGQAAHSHAAEVCCVRRGRSASASGRSGASPRSVTASEHGGDDVADLCDELRGGVLKRAPSPSALYHGHGRFALANSGPPCPPE